MAVIQLDESNPKIGLYTRKSKQGPELELVGRFIDHTINTFKTRNCRLAIFIEPLLDTGFPDVVIAEYNPCVFENSTHDRFSLLPSDLKILHYLYAKRSANAAAIEAQLGIDSKALLRTLERLLDAGLIKRHTKKWKPVSIKQSFAIKKLIAVEAKIKNWNSAFLQAQSNKWFASESYILSPVRRPGSMTLSRSEQMGVGIYSYNQGSVQEIVKSDKLPLPACYASWLFNEWIGHHLQHADKGVSCAVNNTADDSNGNTGFKQRMPD